MDNKRKVIYEFRIKNYTVLGLEGGVPMKAHNRYVIDGGEYTIVPVYDMPGCIAIEADGSFLGKEVEFVLAQPMKDGPTPEYMAARKELADRRFSQPTGKPDETLNSDTGMLIQEMQN